MRDQLNVLVAGRNREDIAPIQSLLEGINGITVGLRHISNGHADPLYNQTRPHALILVLGAGGQTELTALVEHPPAERPPLLVVGPADNTPLIRAAMRAGARDFLESPVAGADLASFIETVRSEIEHAKPLGQATLTAVINAKGGSGASMVAANVAHVFAATSQGRTLLLDMDVQFGTLPSYFNLAPVNGLMQALEVVDTLDPVALKGYVLRHNSGLDLLASAPGDLVLASDVPEHQVEQLLQVLGDVYQEIVVDLPRWIGEAMATVLERADRILLVMQQSVAHLRDTCRMAHILQTELNVAADRVVIVINRFDKRNPISLDDIGEALAPMRVLTLANDYRRVSDSINFGSPLRTHAPRAGITRELERLSSTLSPEAPRESAQGGFWRRLTGTRK